MMMIIFNCANGTKYGQGIEKKKKDRLAPRSAAEPLLEGRLMLSSLPP